MAAILIVAGLAIADKVEKKKEKKRQKRADAAARYRELQIETDQRLARRASTNVIENTFVEDLEDEDENQYHAGPVDEVPPPTYEDVVQAGERREMEWRSEMQRRRSSLNTAHNGSSTSNTQRVA